MRRYGVTPTAENDLTLTFDYIARRNPDAADRLMDAQHIEILRVLHGRRDEAALLAQQGLPPRSKDR